MAREMRGVSAVGPLYARLLSKAGQWYNVSLAAFEAYNAADWAGYAQAMTADGASAVYFADFPAAITAAGSYEYYVHAQQGGSPAETDPVVSTGRVDWTGQASASSVASAMTGQAFRDYIVSSRGFTRTDKDAVLYDAVTDAVQQMRRRFEFDEAEAEHTTTATISVLGQFKIPIEADMGLLLGVMHEDGLIATPLQRRSKLEFDGIYPYINVDPNFTGYPRDYCVYAGQLYIGPIPDSTAYAYRLSYSTRAGAVTAATTGVPFTNLYRDVLADRVLANLYDSLEEYDKAQMYLQKFEDGFTFAVRRERRNAGLTTFNQQPTNY